MKKLFRQTFRNKSTWSLKAIALALAAAAAYATAQFPDMGLPPPQSTNQNETGKDVYTAKVDHVADGDTLTVYDTHGRKRKVRMQAIDAPEKQQAHGRAAGTWLNELLMDKRVQIQVSDIDRYKREVGKVLIQDANCIEATCPFTTDVNLQAVQLGHAWWYRDYSNSLSPQDKQLYAQAEEHAHEPGVVNDAVEIPGVDV